MNSPKELKNLPDLLYDTDYITISAKESTNIDELRHEIFEKLELIRIYLKQPGKEADLEEPMIMKQNDTLEDVCKKIHGDFTRLFKYAQIWGKSAKHPGQRFQRLDHVMKDGDIVQIVLKK